MTMSRRRRMTLMVGLPLAVVAVAVIGFVWWFLRDDAPDAVSLEAAVAVAEAGADATDDAGSGDDAGGDADAEAVGVGGVGGIWTVDTSIGEFSFAEATTSFVGFRVDEELTTIGSTTAVGRTPEVAGTFEIDGTVLVAASIEADMSAVVTETSRRDNRVRDALDTDAFPIAAFVLTDPVDLGAAADTGADVAVSVDGELTIKGVTNPVIVAIEARLVDDIVAVVGSVEIVFADWGVEVPSAPVVLSADDHGIVEWQLLFTRG